MIELGRSVAAQLKRNKQVSVVNGTDFDIYLHQNFLTPQECGGLIAMIDADRKPSTLLATAPDPEFRTSESCDVDRYNAFVAGIDARICDLLGLTERQGETLQGQRYAVGQQFKAHHDYFHASESYFADEVTRGGQRSWTTMIYLDQPAGGGDTAFPLAGFKITPRAGMLLAWNNMDASGKPNNQALHESQPVTAGIKNIVTKWFREGNWV